MHTNANLPSLATTRPVYIGFAVLRGRFGFSNLSGIRGSFVPVVARHILVS